MIVRVEHLGENVYRVLTNASEPGRSIRPGCEYDEEVVPVGPIGIFGWLRQHGMRPSDDSVLPDEDR